MGLGDQIHARTRFLQWTCNEGSAPTSPEVQIQRKPGPDRELGRHKGDMKAMTRLEEDDSSSS